MPKTSRKRKKSYNPYRRKRVYRGFGTAVEQYVPRPRVTSDNKTVTMSYATNVQLSSAISLATHVFRATSLHDPDFTGTGHQAMGHDEYSNIYLRYRVVASRLKLHACNTSGDNLPCVVNIRASEVSTLVGSMDQSLELPFSNPRVLGEAGAGSAAKTWTTPWYYTTQVKGDPGVAYDTEYSANFNANPSRPWFFHIDAYEMGGVNVFVECYATIEFLVSMYDRVQMLTS